MRPRESWADDSLGALAGRWRGVEPETHARESRHPFGDAALASLDAGEIDAITRALAARN